MAVERSQAETTVQYSHGRRLGFRICWGAVIETCTILTTKPNELVAEVHRRMPAILKRDDYGLWLDPGLKNPSAVSHCLEPFDANLMKKYPVGTRVNRPENDDYECAQEISAAVTPTLF